MLNITPTDFTKLRKDNPRNWIRESGYRKFPRYLHETGLVIEGNRIPKSVNFSVSKQAFGLNVFPTSETDIQQARNLVSQLCDTVIAEPDIGTLIEAEFFINLPLKFTDVVQLLQSKENSCFRRKREHVEDCGFYRHGSKKEFVVYDKAFELWHCQNVSLFDLRRTCGNVTRFELTFRNPDLSKQLGNSLKTLDLGRCYTAVRRHILGFNLPDFERYLPECFTEFQNQNWRQNQ